MNLKSFSRKILKIHSLYESDIACERFPHKRSAEDLSEQAMSLQLLTVDRHVLVPVFLLLAEHKHYIVITEQSEVVQVNADIKSERLP